jgi:hypothetical protein
MLGQGNVTHPQTRDVGRMIWKLIAVLTSYSCVLQEWLQGDHAAGEQAAQCSLGLSGLLLSHLSTSLQKRFDVFA